MAMADDKCCGNCGGGCGLTKASFHYCYLCERQKAESLPIYDIDLGFWSEHYAQQKDFTDAMKTGKWGEWRVCVVCANQGHAGWMHGVSQCHCTGGCGGTGVHMLECVDKPPVWLTTPGVKMDNVRVSTYGDYDYVAPKKKKAIKKKKPAQPPERKIAKYLGVDVTINLPQACADFYMLERMMSDGSLGAKRALNALVSRLAPSFHTYLDIAVGGEIRHMHRAEEDDEEYQEYENCEDCPGCLRDDDCCHEPVGIAALGPPGPAPEHLQKFWEAAQGEAMCQVDGGLGRNKSWRIWRRHRRRHGILLLEQAYSAFKDMNWSSSFGGEAWAAITRIAMDYEKGKIKPHLFVDRCWTLQHNGGNVFNKVWGGEECTYLMRVLENQAEENYDYLYKKASKPVQGMWTTRFYNMRRHILEDRDPSWLGVQHTDGETREW